MKYRVKKVAVIGGWEWRVQTGRGLAFRIVGYYATPAEAQAVADNLNQAAAEKPAA